nr:hypothetical protein [Micromonospora sp. DSM 115978]
MSLLSWLFGEPHPRLTSTEVATRPGSKPAKPTTKEVMTATGGVSNRRSMPVCESCGADRPLTVRRNRAVCLGGCP